MTGSALAQAPAGQAVVILEVRGVIDPVVAQYVKHGLDMANHTDAPLVVILLDTPGGLDTAMREIVQAILNSDVPVAVFVEPSGARAASAGVFMTMEKRCVKVPR
jgi:membrane-bound serine protease (ClpP class)